MLADPAVRLIPRAVDSSWRLDQTTKLSTSGFNPFGGTVFYPARSALAGWLADPQQSARLHNPHDALLHDLLFAVHDYLHVWATQLICELRPELGFGSSRIDAHNFEHLTFALLLTEAVATVGLDYWYLATVDLNQVLPIGTSFSGLTVGYHQRHLAEYRRFRPDLEVQSPAFLGELCRFYCSGHFIGFDANDLRRSPLLSRWLTHEVRYGAVQREVSRRWLRYLSDRELAVVEPDLARPIAIDAAWQEELIEAASHALWRKVKADVLEPLPPLVAPPWGSPPSRALDVRFRNLNLVDDDALFAAGTTPVDPQLFAYYFAQVVSRFDHAAFDPEHRKLLPIALERRDAALLRTLVRDQPRLPVQEEPRDLLFVN